MKTMRVKLTTIAPMLGTAAADPDIHGTYIASNAPDALSMEEEIAAVGVEEVIEKGMTIFPKVDGKPVMWPYQIRGFFKSACSALSKIAKTESSKLKAYKKQIDLRIFVFPDASDRSSRAIPIEFDGNIGDCQRPLRAQTAQGERVAIAHSESIPAGATMEFDIVMLNDDDEKLVTEWLDFGSLNGLGQWRNSGAGAFTWEKVSTTKPYSISNLKAT